MKHMVRLLLTFVFLFAFLGANMVNAQIVEDFEGDNPGDTYPTIGDANAEVVDSTGNDKASQVLEVSLTGYHEAAILEVEIPDGNTLADYNTFEFDGYFYQGDVGWKDIQVEAWEVDPSDQSAFDGESDVELGSWNRDDGASTEWEDISIDISNSSDLDGTVYISFGIHAAGTGDEGDGDDLPTMWFADNVTMDFDEDLVIEDLAVQDFEGNDPGDTYPTVGWEESDIEALVVDSTGNDVASNVLEVTLHNYNAAPVVEVELPDDKTLADYNIFEFDGYFYQGDVGGKDIRVEAWSDDPAGSVFNNDDEDVYLGSWHREGEGSTEWEDITVNISNDSDLDGTVYLVFGIHADGTGDIGGDDVVTMWYANNITMGYSDDVEDDNGEDEEDDGYIVPGLEEMEEGDEGLVANWGFLSEHSWSINTDVDDPGSARIEGGTPDNWLNFTGEYGPLKVTDDQTVVVTGQIEFGGDLTNWSALRYGIYGNPNLGDLEDAGTDAAEWSGDAGNVNGYLLTPRSGTHDIATGNGGQGTQWTQHGAWNSTWGGTSMGVVEQAPYRAELTAGTYDFAFSVSTDGEDANEVRWYLFKEDESFWHAGAVTDTIAPRTFNQISIGMINDQEGVDFIELNDVEAQYAEPITLPEAPFSAFWVEDWGFFERTGDWEIEVGPIVGDASIGGDDPSDGWSAVRGGFGTDIVPTEEEAIVVTGDVTFEGGGFEDWSSFRFGLFDTYNAGGLDSTETDGYIWSGPDDEEANAEEGNGYLMLPPHEHGSEQVSWQEIGEDGNMGGIRGGSWISSNNEDSYVLSTATAEPEGAFASEGTYSFGISVQPLGDGSQEINYYLANENQNYVFSDSVIDDSGDLATESFNSILFATQSSTATNVQLEAVQVDLGDPVDLPQPVSTDEEFTDLPNEVSLNQNYPNPFNPTTTISYQLPSDTHVELTVFNMLGQQVMTLVDDQVEAGTHEISFDGADLASGVYLYRLQADGKVITNQMTLVK